MRLLQSFLILSLCYFSSIDLAISEESKSINAKFFSADYVEYSKEEGFIYAEGNINVIKDQYTVTADKLLYDLENDQLWAEGNIKIKDSKDTVVIGETAFLKDKLKVGIISDFAMKFSNTAIVASKLAKRLSENQASLYKSTFTTCEIKCCKKPFWQISSKKTYIDLDNQKMTYKDVFFEVYGIPILYSPYFSHATPKAEAKSGILVPKITSGAIGIPLYLRAKKNLDVTLTPNITKKYTIFDLEMRHKLHSGSYNIKGSYAKIPYTIKEENQEITKDDRFHISSQGDFNKNNFHYGFDLKHVSDKAYLKNYYQIYDNYLTSKLYFNNTKKTDYFSLEGLHFEDLSERGPINKSPLILPKIRTKNVIALNDSETTYLTVENNILSYHQHLFGQLNRASVAFSLSNNILTNNGHIFKVSANTRGDIYNIYNTPNSTTLTRMIPEAELSWRYPLLRSINNTNIVIEPIISSTLGRNFNSSFNKKFQSIDPKTIDISEDNIFLSNRFSGIDYCEFGQRISYGINSALDLNRNYFSIFLGRSDNKNNIPIKGFSSNIGKVELSIANRADIFYRFKSSRKLKPIKQELGVNFYTKNLLFKIAYIKLDNINKYYRLNISNAKDKVEQLHNEITYAINENWIIGNTVQLDLLGEKVSPLLHAIKLTYLNDCFNITMEISNNFTSNKNLGVKRNTGSPSFSIGLKGINM